MKYATVVVPVKRLLAEALASQEGQTRYHLVADSARAAFEADVFMALHGRDGVAHVAAWDAAQETVRTYEVPPEWAGLWICRYLQIAHNAGALEQVTWPRLPMPDAGYRRPDEIARSAKEAAAHHQERLLTMREKAPSLQSMEEILSSLRQCRPEPFAAEARSALQVLRSRALWHDLDTVHEEAVKRTDTAWHQKRAFWRAIAAQTKKVASVYEVLAYADALLERALPLMGE